MEDPHITAHCSSKVEKGWSEEIAACHLSAPELCGSRTTPLAAPSVQVQNNNETAIPKDEEAAVWPGRCLEQLDRSGAACSSSAPTPFTRPSIAGSKPVTQEEHTLTCCPPSRWNVSQGTTTAALDAKRGATAAGTSSSHGNIAQGRLCIDRARIDRVERNREILARTVPAVAPFATASPPNSVVVAKKRQRNETITRRTKRSEEYILDNAKNDDDGRNDDSSEDGLSHSELVQIMARRKRRRPISDEESVDLLRRPCSSIEFYPERFDTLNNYSSFLVNNYPHRNSTGSGSIHATDRWMNSSGGGGDDSDRSDWSSSDDDDSSSSASSYVSELTEPNFVAYYPRLEGTDENDLDDDTNEEPVGGSDLALRIFSVVSTVVLAVDGAWSALSSLFHAK